MDEKNDFQNLDKIVIGSHRTGQPILRIGFQMQLFLRNGHLRPTRYQVVDAMVDIVRTAGPNFKQYQKHMSSRMSRIKDSDALAAAYHAEVERIAPEIQAHGPHVDDGQTPPRWQAVASLQDERSLPIDLSHFYLSTPATIAKNDPGLIDKLLRWCAMVRPLHGTAGRAPVYETGMEYSYPVETWPLLSRFSGLDDLSPFVLAARSVNRIRGVNWLTLLGTPMRDEIGGIDALTTAVTEAWTWLSTWPFSQPEAGVQATGSTR